MELLSSEVLASRVLNASRKLHLPTYIASRFLLETVVSKNNSNWIYETIPRKYLLRKQAPFLKFLKFKNIDENNQPVYREFVVPGPTTLLAEAILLGYIAQVDQFKKSKNVYSYVWPESLSSSYNFEHYISGYKKRNEAIAKYLSGNPNKVVLIADIEKFYPNIDQATVKERFIEKLNNSEIPLQIKELANKFLDDIFSFFSDGRGIITGSEFSHVLGDIALQEIDSVLDAEFDDAYFRYVDDIILIVDPKDKDKTQSLLFNLATKEGLTINSEKSDYISSESWLKHGPHNEQGVVDGSFESLVFKIKSFLHFNPKSEERLSEALNKKGFSIPVGRFSRASKSIDFVGSLRHFIKSGWKVALQTVFANDTSLVRDALEVRERLYNEISNYNENDIPEGPTLRKWHLQRLRYLTNRAVYIFPHDDLGFLRDKLKDIPEFVDSAALLDTLITGNYSSLLSMPGATLNACAGILYQNGKRLKELAISADMTQAEIESASVLSLWDVIDLGLPDKSSSENEDIDSLTISSDISPNESNIDSFSYLTEVKTLSMRKTKTDRLSTLETRFLDSEGSVLDALDIGRTSDY